MVFGVGAGVRVGRLRVGVLARGCVGEAVAAARVAVREGATVRLTVRVTLRVVAVACRVWVARGVAVACLAVAVKVTRMVSIGSTVNGRWVGSSVGRGGGPP